MKNADTQLIWGTKYIDNFWTHKDVWTSTYERPVMLLSKCCVSTIYLLTVIVVFFLHKSDNLWTVSVIVCLHNSFLKLRLIRWKNNCVWCHCVSISIRRFINSLDIAAYRFGMFQFNKFQSLFTEVEKTCVLTLHFLWHNNLS